MTEPAGAQPADLPVELPKKFEFVIKLRRPKPIGLLAKADK